jgi:hypothetical protein
MTRKNLPARVWPMATRELSRLRRSSPGGTKTKPEQGCAADRLQRPLLRRSRFQPRLKRSVRLPICTLARLLLACARMDFEIVGEITSIETFASGSGVRERTRLRRQYGQGRWRKRKGVARVRLVDGTLRLAEIHWYEAHGIGRREFKLKLPFLDARR